jgi:NAD(P)H-nitrite reductase large subunit
LLLLVFRCRRSWCRRGAPALPRPRHREGRSPHAGYRPALSKRYLRGETGAPFAKDAAFYREHDVEVLLETAVTAVELDLRSVVSDGAKFSYGKLLLATGATPRRLDVSGADLESV